MHQIRQKIRQQRFERLRISDRKFVNHTTEMILLLSEQWRVCITCSTEQLLVSMKPSEIDMKDDISHPPVGVLVFSFQLAITPPL